MDFSDLSFSDFDYDEIQPSFIPSEDSAISASSGLRFSPSPLTLPAQLPDHGLPAEGPCFAFYAAMVGYGTGELLQLIRTYCEQHFLPMPDIANEVSILPGSCRIFRNHCLVLQFPLESRSCLMYEEPGFKKAPCLFCGKIFRFWGMSDYQKTYCSKRCQFLHSEWNRPITNVVDFADALRGLR